jgi:hypothetical protein
VTATVASRSSAERPTPPYDELAAVLRGPLTGPAELRRDHAPSVRNALPHRSPMIVARCADAADIVACVRFAGRHGISFALSGGGRTARGWGAGSSALVIDVSAMPRWSVSDLFDADSAWRAGYLPGA